MKKQRIVVIGAGPAGLTAAYELLDRSTAEVTVLEASEVVGGISGTEKYKGYRMDMGGHRFFSKSAEVNEWWDRIMEMPERRRLSRILFEGKFYDYPVTLSFDTLKKLGLAKTMAVGGSYVAACVHKKSEDNLENFYINRFGRKLYEMFFENYTENLWGRHPREIDAAWGAQRVKGLSIKKLLSGAVRGKSNETSLIRKFKYPEHGPGELWEKVAKKITKMGGKIVFRAEVVGLRRVNKKGAWRVEYKQGEKRVSVTADVVISSMPVKDLVKAIMGVPQRISKIADNLPYRDYMTIGVLVPRLMVGKIKDTWIYVQERGVKLGRVQIYNNWSAGLLPKNSKDVWLGLEYFVQEGDELWGMGETEFAEMAGRELVKIGLVENAEEIKDYHLVRVKKAYPAYFDSYKDFAKVREFLNGLPGLYCVGRNGQHRYNNMDHSMLTAIRAVDCIVDGAEKEKVWEVNTEKEYHE